MQSMDCNHGRVRVCYFFLGIIIFCSTHYNSNGIIEDSVLITHFLKFRKTLVFVFMPEHTWIEIDISRNDFARQVKMAATTVFRSLGPK